MSLGCDWEVSYPLKGPHMGPDVVDEGPGAFAKFASHALLSSRGLNSTAL